MKKFIAKVFNLFLHILFLCSLIFSSCDVKGQCVTTTASGGTITPTPGTTWTDFTNTDRGPGIYYDFATTAGRIYSFRTQGGANWTDPYLTISNTSNVSQTFNDNNGPYYTDNCSGGENSSSLDWVAPSSGTYRVHVMRGGCSGWFSGNNSAVLQYRETTPVADAFGNNRWRVYAYNGTDRTLTSSQARFGYFEMPTSVLSFDSKTYFGSASTPSSASGWVGTEVPIDNHTVVYKREGFACGYYSIQVANHDDDARLYVNGAQVWDQTGCCADRGIVWTGYLGLTSTVEFRVQEGCGGSELVANINLVAPTTVVSTTSASSCIYNGSISGEKMLIDNSNNLLVGINEGSVNLGTVSATVNISGSTPTFGTTNSPSCVSYTGGEYFLQRSFFITTDASYPLSTPVEVNLYFTQAELNNLNATTSSASADYQTCYGTVDATGSNLMLTIQHSNGSFSTRTQGGGGLTLTPNTPSTNIYRATFTTDRFSLFRLHGAGGLYSNNALPVKLTMFKANAIDNSFIKLDWTTAQEIENSGFEIERSEDGVNFIKIGWEKGFGNSTEKRDYSYDDKTVMSGVTYYYRLKQIDFDGKFEYFNIVSARINGRDEFIVSDFMPTEVRGNTKLDIFTTNNRDIALAVFNTLGQPILSRKESLTVGNNKIEFSFDNLPAGTYMTSIKSNNEFISRKFVVIR